MDVDDGRVTAPKPAPTKHTQALSPTEIALTALAVIFGLSVLILCLYIWWEKRKWRKRKEKRRIEIRIATTPPPLPLHPTTSPPPLRPTTPPPPPHHLTTPPLPHHPTTPPPPPHHPNTPPPPRHHPTTPPPPHHPTAPPLPEGSIIIPMSAILPPILLSAAVGITSKTYTILASFNQILCRQTSHQKKIFKVDSYIGVAIAGLTADGRVLAKSLRSECVSYTHKYNSPLPVGRLVVQLPYKPQVSTQLSWKRPHGVDSLLAGVDESGAHLYYNFSECQAFAIGYRSQAANAYLERKLEDFVSTTREDLIKDAIFALRETLEGERLTSSNCTVSVVGVNEVFHILDEEFVQIYIDCSNGLK